MESKFTLTVTAPPLHDDQDQTTATSAGNPMTSTNNSQLALSSLELSEWADKLLTAIAQLIVSLDLDKNIHNEKLSLVDIITGLISRTESMPAVADLQTDNEDTRRKCNTLAEINANLSKEWHAASQAIRRDEAATLSDRLKFYKAKASEYITAIKSAQERLSLVGYHGGLSNESHAALRKSLDDERARHEDLTRSLAAYKDFPTDEADLQAEIVRLQTQISELSFSRP